MTSSEVKSFWRKWEKMDELKRLEWVEELTGVDELNSTLMNSYFEDLYNYCIGKTLLSEVQSR